MMRASYALPRTSSSTPFQCKKTRDSIRDPGFFDSKGWGSRRPNHPDRIGIVLPGGCSRRLLPRDVPRPQAYGTAIAAANGPEGSMVKMTAPPLHYVFDHWVLHKLLVISVKFSGGSFRRARPGIGAERVTGAEALGAAAISNGSTTPPGPKPLDRTQLGCETS